MFNVRTLYYLYANIVPSASRPLTFYLSHSNIKRLQIGSLWTGEARWEPEISVNRSHMQFLKAMALDMPFRHGRKALVIFCSCAGENCSSVGRRRAVLGSPHPQNPPHFSHFRLRSREHVIGMEPSSLMLIGSGGF